MSALMTRARTGLMAAALAVALAVAGAGAAWAVTTGWTVTFTGDKMESDGTADIMASVRQMQPGDSATYDIDLYNKYDGDADWYMKTSVLHTMEEMAENGGGSYTYRLAYTNPAGVERVIYTNDTVSGDSSAMDTEGLKDINGSMGEWFFLDTLGAGVHADITLAVSLDPESHGNSYFDTEGSLQLSFAAEPSAKEPTEQTPPPPTTDEPKDEAKDKPSDPISKLAQTGDVVMLVAGGVAVVAVIAVVLLIVARRRSRTAEEGEKR
ncbi:MAG: hypothetical protein HFJ75_00735 [Eggerthellaceae bacterium]|nr:hypothetical protein [Eggerthellaceae bacterium]